MLGIYYRNISRHSRDDAWNVTAVNIVTYVLAICSLLLHIS